MAFSYLEAKTVRDAFESSKTYMQPLFTPLDEFQRIADNKPHASIDPAYPKTTDGTAASIVSKTPKRVIQQLPTGKVISETNDWLTHVAGFKFTHEIIPNANHQFSLLQKYWSGVQKALTFGSCPAYVPFMNSGTYFGTDLSIPFIKDVFYEPGKVSDKDSNYIFMRSFYQPHDIDAIIDRETNLSDKAKARKEKYESGWDVPALRKLRDSISSDTDQTGSKTERERRNRKGGIEIIHAFQKGVGAEFYSFHASSGVVVRTKKNKDPRGIIPIHTMYIDTDLTNPLGRGYIEVVGAMQNLLDSEVQMYQYNRALQLGAPMVKRGSWNKTQAKLIPNAIIDLGSDPNNSLELLKLDNTALNNFPANYGLMKSQLINLLSSPDTSISSEVGNPGFSKTDAGVKSQAANVSIDDNYIRKQFESWFQDIAETQINLYFAEKSGIEEVQLDKETASKIRALDATLVSPDDKIKLDYDTETEKLKFRVDASTSNMKDDADQLEKTTNLLDFTQKYPMLDSRYGGPIVVDELARRIVIISGIEDPEKVAPPPPEQDPNAQQDPNGQGPMPNPMMPHPKESINYKDAPEDIKRQMEQQAGFQPSAQTSPVQQQNDLKAQDLNIKGQQAHVQAIGAAHAHASQHVQDMNPQSQQPDMVDPNAPTDQLTGQQPEPQAPQQAPGMTPDDMAFAQEIIKLGFSEQEAGQAVAMLHHGKTPDEIVQILGGSQ